MMNKFAISRPSRVAVLAALAAGASMAQAAVDVTPITDTKADVLAVGVAVLSVAIAIKLYKWIRAAL